MFASSYKRGIRLRFYYFPASLTLTAMTVAVTSCDKSNKN